MKTPQHPLDNLFSELQKAPQGPFSGVAGGLCSLLAAQFARQSGITLLLVPTSERAGNLADEVRTWLAGRANRVHVFLPERRSVYDQTAADPDVCSSRLAALGLEHSGGGLVIAPFSVLLERFYAPQAWRKACMKIGTGSTLIRDPFVGQLVQLGYRRVPLVEEPGQFAVRGSLIDVFPPTSEFPVRLDFFGDDLETMKLFSIETQRTLDKISEMTLVPVLEHLPDPADIGQLVQVVREKAQSLEPTFQELIQRKIEHLLSHADSRDFFELQPFRAKSGCFLWDFWKSPRVFVETPDQLEEGLKEGVREQETAYQKCSGLTPLPGPEAYYHDPSTVLAGLQSLNVAGISRFKNPHQDGVVFEVEPVPPPNDLSKETLLKDVKRWLSGDWAVVIILGDEQRFHNLKGLLGERKVAIRSNPDPMNFSYGSVSIIKGTVDRGFLSPRDKIAVLCEEDIYPQARTEGRHQKTPASQIAWSISQLIPGDIVVHADHGVAEYRGIQTMVAAGIQREYLLLQYAGSDKLFVPTDQVHKVQKYIGMEGARPTIHSLNSKVWETQKKRVKKNVEYIAKELLQLYAKREASEGFPFLPDGELQMEMERRFPFVETPDQMKAIQSVKSDMEAVTPMDRIVCGDVGYGKTEVAIRAAFKAVCSGKQVAVLAPTTLLSFQHLQTFTGRLEGLPVRIGLVSRLVSAKEQDRVIEKTKSGLVDILIGTHRILSNDIRFKDLGLLVIDEEQRFGVKHKEKFKHLRENLDVLTLTATPIPRTLHMALSGIRQISVIDTPPVDRRPIHTYVAPFEASWAKRAMIEELKRGGQVYYVFNRVEKIEQKAQFLRELVPEARIAVAHGQMVETLVEKTMLAFIKQEYDVLLATTIIESGLDIPNVNTLIVDEAERLGLAQMYQLRGRVGRSARQAYAYFFYSKGKKLTQEAHDRLATIEEHTALGSGFKIALRDLQIRGAGNILGAEQSGHIAAVGFALYVELLEEAVAQVRGQKVEKPLESAIEIPVTALFPPTYIPEEDTRIDMYARLAKCGDPEVLKLLKAECEDRFGPVPIEAQRLFKVAGVRVLAAKNGIVKISLLMNRLRFEFDAALMPPPEKIIDVRTAFFQRFSMNPSDPNALQISLAGIPTDQTLDFAEKFLTHIGLTRDEQNQPNQRKTDEKYPQRYSGERLPCIKA